MLMEQVLFNLLDNAAKYAPEGSRVRIEGWHETRHEGEAVVLAILDEARASRRATRSGSSTPSTG